MPIFLFLILFSGGCAVTKQPAGQSLPGWMKGRFEDDYGIKYSVNDSAFIMEPSTKYHILEWNEKEQYLLACNNENNKTEKGLYTRIDYMQFSGMEPFTWGFCFTVYDAPDTTAALKAPAADRNNPRKGCGGYPFSRMKKVAK